METPNLLNLHDFLYEKADKGLFFGVLGRPISHSLSPLIHNFALRKIGLGATYYPILVDEGEEVRLGELFSHPNFRGANITIPLKQIVLDHVQICSDLVQITGAANTIFLTSQGEIKADNTDIYGFLEPLRPLNHLISKKNALVFGSGGASRAVVYALKSIGMRSIYLVSRNPEAIDMLDVIPVSYKDWTTYLSDCNLIVNTTPIGMYPNFNASVIDVNLSSHLADKVCYDLIYRPLETKFLHQARLNGALTINGLDMFLGQAAQSFRLFTNTDFPSAEARSVLMEHLNFQQQNAR